MPGQPPQKSHEVAAASETRPPVSHTPAPNALIPAKRRNVRRDDRPASAVDALMASSSIYSNPLLFQRKWGFNPLGRLERSFFGEQGLDPAPVVRDSSDQDPSFEVEEIKKGLLPFMWVARS